MLKGIAKPFLMVYPHKIHWKLYISNSKLAGIVGDYVTLITPLQITLQSSCLEHKGFDTHLFLEKVIH